MKFTMTLLIGMCLPIQVQARSEIKDDLIFPLTTISVS